MDKADFLSVENMKLCQSVFTNYMMDRYDFDVIKDAKNTNIKKILFDIMTNVNQRYANSKDVTFKDMNNITLNIARDNYKGSYKLHKKTNKTNVRSLEREQNAYGPRILNFEQIKPEPTFKKSVESEYDSIEDSRKKENEKITPIVPELKPIIESAYNADEFQNKLNQLAQKRESIEIKDLTSINDTRIQQDTLQASLATKDPKALYTLTRDENQANENIIKEQNLSIKTSRVELLPSPTNQLMLIDKFLCINGFDRNWQVHKHRFNFQVDFQFNENSIQQRYKNIKSIKVTRVIIPMEIKEMRSLHNVPKTFYNHEFRFGYPYLMLNIDEFSDVYDGTNDKIRKSFCHLIFDKCYQSPNGRGYIVLNTMQGEKKIFHPTPLTSLSKLSISIVKPNGEIFNDSKDEYKVFKVEYEANNSKYLKIVTCKYFDKNEFYRGDNIIINDFALQNVTPTMSDMAIREFNAFINRKEGHEIVEIGQPNDAGYFRTFYVLGPGAFDKTSGNFVIQPDLITNLNIFNNNFDFSCETTTNGAIINTSLQCTLSMKLQTVATDPNVIDTSYFPKSSTLLG